MTNSEVSPSSTTRRVLLGVLTIVVIVALAVVGYLYGGRLFGPSFKGNLVLSFPAPWTAPDKEVFSGLVSYDTAKNSFYNLTMPQQGILFNYSRGNLSPDGTKLIVTQVASTTYSLAIYSLPLQKVTTVLDSRPIGTHFSSTYWSGDGKKIAYIASAQTIDKNTIATDGKPFLVLQNGKYTSRPGAQLSAAFRASGFVISTDGSHKISLGSVEPSVFSPDSSMVLGLSQQTLSLVAVSLADGTQKTIARPKDDVFPAGNVNFVYDTNGEHIGVLGKTGPLVVYNIDWKNATLTKAGITAKRPITAIFGQSGQLLSFEGASHEVAVYTFTASSTGMTRQTYSLTLPSTAQLLGWISAK